jgi:hypothetical protein
METSRTGVYYDVGRSLSLQCYPVFLNETVTVTDLYKCNSCY